MKGTQDGFAEMARHYDALMVHVDYDRWFYTAGVLAEIMPGGFRHLDAACGTGVLMAMTRRAGWRSTGLDLSLAMLQAGRKQRSPLPVAQADLRNLPVRGMHFVTCLFDSMNFLLEDGEIRQAIRSLGDAMTDGALLYFDMVTERMMLEHFAGQTWTEENDGFSTTWANEYDPDRKICLTRVRIDSGEESVTRERAYDPDFVAGAIHDAGLELLGVYDAESWRAPSRKTTRMDFVAAKRPTAAMTRRFPALVDEIRLFLRA